MTGIRAEPGMGLAPFRCDVTPPLGHSLSGGWIPPVIGYDDALEAIGYVLLGAGPPIVVCAIDWAGMQNEAYAVWRSHLAAAAGTTPDRVALQCVHQHNSLLVCLDAAQELSNQPGLPPVVDLKFFQECLDRATKSLTEALRHPRPISHVARGEAAVRHVASNRRVSRDARGVVLASRWSACKDPQLQALPEGLIDPMLKTVAFFDQETKIVSCHYYATHPMSYYRDGRVTSDFCGLARKRRQAEEPGCTHLYFTGCSGNITAGKYNDGSKRARQELTQRMYEGIVASEAGWSPQPLGKIAWRTTEIMPEPNPALAADKLLAAIADVTLEPVRRMVAAFHLAWLRRQGRNEPLLLSSLQLNDIAILHLPGEPFVEYQLRAQRLAPDRMVAVAAYGDFGPWYLPTREEYKCGGYEVGVALCSENIDGMLEAGIRKLLVRD
jgi:hypothetical protein